MTKIMNEQDFDMQNSFGRGGPNDTYAEYFSGRSFVKNLVSPEATKLGIINVTFEPGCRNNWHIHHASEGGGQILLCVAGEGWYQEEGKDARKLKAGDIVLIPANVKHWHGASQDSWFSHLAIEIPGTEAYNEWCEPVNEMEYGNLEA